MSGGRGKHVVVWEWQNDQGRWRPYSSEITNHLEQAYVKKWPSILLGYIDKELVDLSIDMSSFQLIESIENSNNYIRNVRRSIYPQTSPAGKGVVWQWAGEPTGFWYRYDMSIQCIFEAAWANGVKILDLKQIGIKTFSTDENIDFSHCNYIMDFSQSIQINKDTGQNRAIMRVIEHPYPLDMSGLLPLTQNDKEDFVIDSGNKKEIKKKKPTRNKRIDKSKKNLEDKSKKNLDDKSKKNHDPKSEIFSSKDEIIRSSSENSVKSDLNNDQIENLLQRVAKPAHVDLGGDCSICLSSLTTDSSYTQASAGFIVSHAVSLVICKHSFHEDCLLELVKSKSCAYIQCPNCQIFYGEKIGIQPPGEMIIKYIKMSIPGYPENDAIEITYKIPPGIQTKEHPHPGKPYHPVGFPRKAYLPNNENGQKVLQLLKEAFRKRLIFTVGKSVTTGMEDVVTWNEIHHKTSIHDTNGHGYPDPTYLDNVIAELAVQGVI